MMEEVLCLECSLVMLGRGGGGVGGTRVWDGDVIAALEVETEGVTGMDVGGEVCADGGFDVEASVNTIFE